MPDTISQLLVRGRRIDEDSKSTLHTVRDWLRSVSGGQPDSKYQKDLDRNARLLDILARSISREVEGMVLDVTGEHGEMGTKMVEVAQKRFDGDDMEE